MVATLKILESINRKLDIAKFFLIYSLIIGVVISLILPIGQTPDELVHMKQMCDSFGMHGAYDQYVDAVYTYNLAESAIQGEKIDTIKLETTNQIHFNKEEISFSPKFNLQFLSYVPTFIGFILGYIFNAPISICMWLGEFFNLIFAAIIGSASLKYMPIKKEMLLAVMLLPMCVHQYASINYDAILLPLCFLLTAYCLYLKIEAEEVKILNIVIVLALMFVIATIKPPYALIGLIILGIPSEKINIRFGKLDCGKLLGLVQKYWYISIILAIIVGALGLFVLKDQRYISLIVTSILQPVHYLRLLYHTITYYFEFFYISAIGNFGYLSMPLPKVLVWIIYILLIVYAVLPIHLASEKIKNSDKSSDNTTNAITIGDKLLYIAISFVIFNMVFIAMISHSFLLYGLQYGPLSATMASFTSIGRIEGVQGRYFIPFMPLLLLCINDLFKNSKLSSNKARIETRINTGIIVESMERLFLIVLGIVSILIISGKLY